MAENLQQVETYYEKVVAIAQRLLLGQDFREREVRKVLDGQSKLPLIEAKDTPGERSYLLGLSDRVQDVKDLLELRKSGKI